MTAYELFLRRNLAHAAEHPHARASTEPSLRAVLLTCADHRVDPAHVLGVGLNEAVVVRNPGGRVTAGFLQSVAVLAAIGAVEGIDPGFELIVVHHTDCGLSRLTSPAYLPLLAPYFGTDPDDVPSRSLAAPHLSVRDDVDRLCAHPFVPDTLVVSGLVYDVDDGHVDTVLRPARIGELRAAR